VPSDERRQVRPDPAKILEHDTGRGIILRIIRGGTPLQEPDQHPDDSLMRRLVGHRTSPHRHGVVHIRSHWRRLPSAGPTNFAILRSRSAAALNVHPRTPRATASLGPRLARHLARHSAGPREPLGILVGAALAVPRRGHDGGDHGCPGFSNGFTAKVILSTAIQGIGSGRNGRFAGMCWRIRRGPLAHASESSRRECTTSRSGPSDVWRRPSACSEWICWNDYWRHPWLMARLFRSLRSPSPLLRGR
jgi:hypothetical protein